MVSTGSGDQAIVAAIQRAELYAVSDRDDEALALLDEALQHDPGHPDLLANRAWILNRLGRGHEALDAANAALSLEPTLAQALFQRSHALSGTGAHAEAENASLRGLEFHPEQVDFHLLYAMQLASHLGRGRRKKDRRALALNHTETALALNPEHSGSLLSAARIAWTLENTDLAEHYVNQGLALAPEDLGLLTLRADLNAATTRPNSRYDTVSRPLAVARESNRLLQLDPQHRGARRTLFLSIWDELSLLIDGPIGIATLTALNYAVCFRSSGELWSPIPGTLLVLLFAVIRLVGSTRIMSQANPGFRRALTHDLPFATLRRVLVIACWSITLSCAVLALFVRDAIAVRIIIVALAITIVAAFTASLLLSSGLRTAAQGVGGYAADVQSLSRLALLRTAMRGRTWIRVFAFLGVSVLAATAAASGRSDATHVAFIAASAFVLSPITALVATRLLERRTRNDLPEGTVVLPATYQTPGVASALLTTATITVAAAILFVNTAAVPVLANSYDAIGTYVKASPAQGNAGSGSSCSGRPATRLACIARKAQEAQQRDYGLPQVEVPQIDVPDVTVPDLDSLKVE